MNRPGPITIETFTMNDALQCSHCNAKTYPWMRRGNEWQCVRCWNWSTQYEPVTGGKT